MFSWSISKSAEAMFSRWAIKRVCKFLLKKKLGKFILGDIDLNQLDVQLGAGTIQLSDLALNVDYINEKVRLTLLMLVRLFLFFNQIYLFDHRQVRFIFVKNYVRLLRFFIHDV